MLDIVSGWCEVKPARRSNRRPFFGAKGPRVRARGGDRFEPMWDASHRALASPPTRSPFPQARWWSELRPGLTISSTRLAVCRRDIACTSDPASARLTGRHEMRVLREPRKVTFSGKMNQRCPPLANGKREPVAGGCVFTRVVGRRYRVEPDLLRFGPRQGRPHFSYLAGGVK